MMFKEDIKTVFPLLKELYDLDGLILVGSDVTLWENLSEQTDIEDVHYVNTQEQKQISFPSEWHIHEQLLAKEDGIVSYYDLSNPQLSGTLPSEVLTTLWRNLKTVDIREKKALSLETFMSKVSTRKNALVVNSFDTVDIVQNSAGVEVIIAATIESDDESLTHYSKSTLDAEMKKLGYKALAFLEDKHPQIFSAVYVIDKEKQKEELETLNAALRTKTQESEKLSQEQAILKEEKQKVAQAFETEKANAETLQKEKEETAKALQNKNSEVETLKNEFKTKIEALTKSLEQEKQNSTNLKKELETLNAALQTKTQESDKLRDERKKLTEETNTLKNQMTLILQQSTLKLSQDYLDTLSKEKKIETIVSHCINQDDVLEAIDTFVLGKSLSQEEKFDVCCEFALQIAKNGDRFQGVSFINNAKYFLAEDEKNKEQYLKLIDISIKLNQLDLTIDLEMEYNEKYGHYSPELNKKLSEKYKNIRSASQKKQQHGHDLLIDYVETNIKDGEGNGKVMVEIGTTRENIPGQGSTLQLARLCKKKGIKFITVDMDPHNTRWANFISQRYKLNIEAITEKGEVFLKKHIDTFDFVFLDAYDFDHGMHSDLRQSRYKQFLGDKIDEKKAHKMHLKCAKSVVKKLRENGVVCVDDTWQDENGTWTAKGTLAVPYLLKKNWHISDQRNNAVLMER